MKNIQVTDDAEVVFGSEETRDTQEEESEKSVRGLQTLHHKTKTPQDAARPIFTLSPRQWLIELAIKGTASTVIRR